MNINKTNTKGLRILKRIGIVLAAFLLTAAVLYSLFAFSSIPICVTGRHMLIETAMSTMRHQWIATSFFPKSVVDEVMDKVNAARDEQIGLESTWTDIPEVPAAPETPSSPSEPSLPETPVTPPSKPEITPPVVVQPETPVVPPSPEELAFYELFHELEQSSMAAYLKDHPDALQNGWEKLYINEAGLDDAGTSIKTKQGDQVLAVDAENGVLLIRMTGTGYRGVLAIGKDPSRLSIQAAATIGKSGQYLGTIVKNNGGVLGLTANGFEDYDEEGNPGKGNGGILSGFTMCDGVPMGEHLDWGWKRIELRDDDRMYIVDSKAPVSENCTDASEFTPALIIDGKVLVDEYCGWNAINPRACIGQSRKGEIMMLCIEGRQITSLGIGVVKCAEMLASYDCMQAMNLDGGTSAIMWYRGECVTKCSNPDLPYGRPLPNAYVFAGTM